MIIALMGTPSSGKSFLARKIAEHYGYKHYSMGDLRRKAAEEKGMTLAEYNALGETEDTDTEFDEFQTALGKKEDDFVIDGRMGAYCIPHALKVFVDADEAVRAERMLAEDPEHQRIGESASDVSEAVRMMRARVESDKKRYIRHYDFDPYNPEAYDIVIDTTNLDKGASVKELLRLIEARRQE